MSDTASVKVQQERRTRKVPAIVLDRPGFQPARMITFLLVGTVVGATLGFLYWWLLGSGPDDVAIPGQATGLLPPYVLPFLLIGLLVGLAWGFLEGRTVTPRRDTVEVEVARARIRRRSTSTEIERR